MKLSNKKLFNDFFIIISYNFSFQIINTYTEAVQTVQPQLAVGKLHTLWVEFGKFYEENGQIADARVVFEKATHVPYTKVDDLASVWCEWAEMEIRHGYGILLFCKIVI